MLLRSLSTWAGDGRIPTDDATCYVLCNDTATAIPTAPRLQGRAQRRITALQNRDHMRRTTCSPPATPAPLPSRRLVPHLKAPRQRALKRRISLPCRLTIGRGKTHRVSLRPKDDGPRLVSEETKQRIRNGTPRQRSHILPCLSFSNQTKP